MPPGMGERTTVFLHGMSGNLLGKHQDEVLASNIVGVYTWSGQAGGGENSVPWAITEADRCP